MRTEFGEQLTRRSEVALEPRPNLLNHERVVVLGVALGIERASDRHHAVSRHTRRLVGCGEDRVVRREKPSVDAEVKLRPSRVASF
jgi:hypothetical protein